MQIYTPMSPMRRRYSVRSLQNSNTLQCKLIIGKLTVLFCFQSNPNMKLTCAVPHMIFVNSLLVLTTYVIREGSGEHVRLRNLARVSLLTIIKFEADKDSDQIKF